MGTESGSHSISIVGARQHNLKNLDVSIPKGRLTVVTGPSGSGKTSLVLDTLGAESAFRLALLGGRADTLSLARPAVTSILGLPPLIILDKRPLRGNTHSLASFLGFDYAAWQLARAQTERPCPRCASKIEAITRPDAVQTILSRYSGRLMSLAARMQPGPIDGQRALAAGYSRIVVEQVEYDLESIGVPDRTADSPAIVLDRLVIDAASEGRILDAFERVSKLGGIGLLVSHIEGPANPSRPTAAFLSEQGACSACGYAGTPLNAALFDFRLTPGTPEMAPGHHPFIGLSQLDDTSTREILSIQAGPISLANLVDLEIGELNRLISEWREGPALPFAQPVDQLDRLGLQHLSLGRRLESLSAGELHRLRIAKLLGYSAPGIGYLMDEPSIGLHSSDTLRLVDALFRLRARGHTIIVVEHDRTIIENADHLIALGPGSGVRGGQIVPVGSDSRPSLPAREPRPPASSFIRIGGVRINNLKDFTLEIPLERLVCVSGISGSGKSTLVVQALLPLVRRALKEARRGKGAPTTTREIGVFQICGRLSEVIHAPHAGRRAVPFSSVATFCGLHERLRELYAALPVARQRGYSRSSFSLGATRASLKCSSCLGSGRFATAAGERECPECRGRRYQKAALDVRYKGVSLPELLDLSCTRALDLLSAIPGCREILERLQTLGLEYLPLGQPTGTLSDGELQRLRLARDLVANRSGCLYIFDEPTSGLDDQEVVNLLRILRDLVLAGNSVIAIEHNLDFIETADYIIDMGPGPGSRGGEVIFAGDPAALLGVTASATAAALRQRHLVRERS